MAIFYISDIHFGHERVIKFDNRPFETVEEMDEVLIERWNTKVTDKDEVYMLGDFAYRSKEKLEYYLERLKGRKHLIIGNHDYQCLLKSEKAVNLLETTDKLVFINDNGREVMLCHFPIADWPKRHHGAYHIYGHIHGRKNEVSQFMCGLEKALNAGCMINGYEPVTLDELIEHNDKHREIILEEI